MKYRGKRTDNEEIIYGSLYYSGGLCFISDNSIKQTKNYSINPKSISIFFGKKDKNGKEIYTNDKVKYKSKEFEVRYFEEYGAFGLYDEKHNRPLGRSGSSTKYEPYFMNDYHCRQMEVI